MGFAEVVTEVSFEFEKVGVPAPFWILGGVLCFLILLAAGIVGVVLFLARNRNRDRPADTR